uniref:PHD-type domain-containing protein n=1 Tax=Anopheles funestus TaxID=62324 RepID=A0A4Y0BF26_ANOFN
MVQCDECDRWWHFDCAGVSSDVKDVRWVCERCENGEKDEIAEVKSHDPSGEPNRASRVKRSRSQDGESFKPCPKKTLRAIPPQPAKESVSGKVVTPKRMAEKDEKVPDRMRSVDGHSRGSVASSARKSNSSASTSLQLSRLKREQDLQVAALQADVEAQTAKLRLSYETKLQQIEEYSESRRSGSSVSKNSKVMDWLSNHHVEDEPLSLHVSGRRSSSATSQQMPTTTVTTTAIERASARKIWRRKLPAFSGAAKEWPVFYSYYKESTEACGYTSVENIMRLEEALTGPAREAVESKFTLPNAAPLVIKMLKQLFGRPALLVKELIEQARRAEAPKPERLDQLISFGIIVQKLCDHLTACEMEDHMANPELLEELVDKLPVSRALEWVDFKGRFRKATLKEFGEFMANLTMKCCELKAPVKLEFRLPYIMAIGVSTLTRSWMKDHHLRWLKQR